MGNLLFCREGGFEIAGFAGLKATNLQFSFLGFRRIAKRDSVAALEGTMRPKKHTIRRDQVICSERGSTRSST